MPGLRRPSATTGSAIDRVRTVHAAAHSDAGLNVAPWHRALLGSARGRMDDASLKQLTGLYVYG